MATARVNLTFALGIRSSSGNHRIPSNIPAAYLFPGTETCKGGGSDVGEKADLNSSHKDMATAPLATLGNIWKYLRDLILVLRVGFCGRFRQLASEFTLPELARKYGTAPLSMRRIGCVRADE
jgi:hypothetical protein